MKKIYTASWNLFTSTAEADRVFCPFVKFFTVFFHWMYKMKYSCYQQSSVIHGWFLYWIFGWEMRRLSKLEIGFRMTSFSFFTLLDTGWKVPQAILALLNSFQELHLEWYKAWVIIVYSVCVCFLYLISWSRAQFIKLVYARLYDLRQWSDLVWGLI